jgi:DNA-binding transcriptional LysR family regulator
MGSFPIEKFNIGVLRTIPSTLVLNFTIYLWKNKLLSISIIEEGRKGLIAGLNDGSFDLILTDQPEIQPDRYNSINLGSTQLVAFTNMHMEISKENFPENVHHLPYLSFATEGQTQIEIDHYFQRHDMNPLNFGKIDDISLIKLVTEQNDCFGILPRCAISHELIIGSLREVGILENSNYGLWAVYSKISQKRESLINAIRAYKEKASKDWE